MHYEMTPYGWTSVPDGNEPGSDGNPFVVHVNPLPGSPSNPTLTTGGGTLPSDSPGRANPAQTGGGYDPYTIPQPEPAIVPYPDQAGSPAPSVASPSDSPSPAPTSTGGSSGAGTGGGSGSGWGALSGEIATRAFCLLTGVVLLITGLVWAMKR